MFKWIEKRRSNKAVQARVEEKRKDYMRPYRVAKRLQLRVQQAISDGNWDRAKTLLRRMRRVRDYQIRVYGR